jgi:hypothetical protein
MNDQGGKQGGKPGPKPGTKMGRIPADDVRVLADHVAGRDADEDGAMDVLDEALAGVLEEAEARGLDALSPARRVLLALCELDIGVRSEGLAYTLLNGAQLLDAMVEASGALGLPVIEEVVTRGAKLIPAQVLEGEDPAADARWLEGLSAQQQQAFGDLEQQLVEHEPEDGYAGVAMAWIVKHRGEFV